MNAIFANSIQTKDPARALRPRQLAGYVQANHGNDMAKLLASGFDAVSTNNAQQPLPKPEITDLRHGNSGQILMRVAPIANARNYEPQCALIGPGGTPGPWVSAGLFSNSRSMPVNALTPGSEYLFRVRALGGSTGRACGGSGSLGLIASKLGFTKTALGGSGATSTARARAHLAGA